MVSSPSGGKFRAIMLANLDYGNLPVRFEPDFCWIRPQPKLPQLNRRAVGEITSPLATKANFQP